MDELERRFHQAMIAIYETAKCELGFLQMVSEYGGLQAAKRLISSPQPSESFTTLWQHKRLDLTVEAHVLASEFEPLFSDAERDVARRRLEQYGWRPPRAT